MQQIGPGDLWVGTADGLQRSQAVKLGCNPVRVSRIVYRLDLQRSQAVKLGCNGG